MTDVLITERQKEILDRDIGVEASEGRGRDWNHAAPIQRMPGTSRNQREWDPADALSSHSWPPEL